MKQSTVVLNADFVDLLGGSLATALVLSLAVECQLANLDARGRPMWWAKTSEEWTAETCLGRRALGGARRRLEAYPWWARSDRDNVARYRVDLSALAARVERMKRRRAERQGEVQACAV